MNDKTVLFEQDGPVGIMTLNRPEYMNSYNNELGSAFIHILDKVKNNKQIRVLVITGAGRIFSAGVDLKASRQALADRENQNKQWHDELLQWITTAPKAMIELGKPIIAAINGPAIGLGCSIGLACDIRIAASSAKFALSFSKVGLIPEFSSTFLLPRIIGLAKTLEISLTNRMFDAEEALKIGLVTEVVPDNDLTTRAREFALMLSKNSPLSMALVKQGFYMGAMCKLDEQLQWEGKYLDVCFDSNDHIEGVRAFLEKREPCF